MELMEGRCALNLDRSTPPPPDENVLINWALITTPETTISSIKKLSDYVDTRIKGAIDGSTPLLH